MPIEFNMGELQLWSLDETPVKLGDLKAVPTVNEFNDNTNLTTTYRLPSSIETSFSIETIIVPKRARKLIVYGWKAKGPVRKRMLDRARYMGMPILLKKQFVITGIKA